MAPNHTLDVRPIAGRIGAEIHGIDIAQPLDDATVAAIRAALLDLRFRWRPGDVAFWDNRSTAHQAPRDVDDDVERVLHRVTFIGDVPVGPDGRESDLVAGRPFEADAAIATAAAPATAPATATATG